VLETIETGYEGKYDFPARPEAPEFSYVLASVPRTGSTWFSHLLWQTGCLGAPLEYLNFLPAGPYGFANRSPSQQLWLWRSVLRRRTSPNGIFGLKCFPDQLELLRQSNPRLLDEVLSVVLPASSPRFVLWLRRRDRVAQAISAARAQLSGIWRKDQEDQAGNVRVEYSEVAIRQAERLIEAQEAAWQEMFRDLRIEPLELWYEDALASPKRHVQQVADYLGVTLDDEQRAIVPTIEKQAEGDAREWRERYTGRE
jgi:LPS sulfotransferase NodH